MQLNQPQQISGSKLRRANHSNAQIKQYIEAFKASSSTMTEFCRKNQLALSTFSKWFNHSKGSVKPFKPLIVAEVPKPAPEQLIQQHMMLEFRGIKLTFSSSTTPALIVDIIKGLAK